MLPEENIIWKSKNCNQFDVTDKKTAHLLCLSWSTLCILVNIFIIYIFLKGNQHRNGFYVIILNLSFTKIIRILNDNLLIFYYASNYEFILINNVSSVSSMLSHNHMLLGTLLLFDNILECEVCYKTLVYLIWIIFSILEIVIVTLNNTYLYIFHFFYVTVLEIICFLIIIFETVIYIFKIQNSYHKMRMHIALVIAVMNFIPQLLKLLAIFSVGFDNSFVIATLLLHGCSSLNIGVFMWHDIELRNQIYNLFSKHCPRKETSDLDH